MNQARQDCRWVKQRFALSCDVVTHASLMHLTQVMVTTAKADQLFGMRKTQQQTSAHEVLQ